MSSWFVHPSYLWLLAIAAAPILIHLLFRLRYRRVRWPAMDFLLAIQRKNRRRVRLDQWILLAARCLLIAGIVAIIARPLLGESAAALLESGPRSEHVVVLDDTASMGELANGSTAFSRATTSMLRLVDRLSDRANRHLFSLTVTTQPDKPAFGPSSLDAEQAASLHRTWEKAEPTFATAGPAAALDSAEARLSTSAASERVLHVISDFRKADWDAGGDAMASLQRMARAGVKIRMLDAAAIESQAPNLTIERVAVTKPPVAVGVPIPVEVVVKNNGERPATNAMIRTIVDGKPTPDRIIASIEPGKTKSISLDVYAVEAGIKNIVVETAADPLPADSKRHLAMNVSLASPVLLVDGDDREREARLVSVALSPGGTAVTGWTITRRNASGLATAGLSSFGAVWLLNVGDLTEADVSALEKFVAGGGGLAVFLGERTSPKVMESLLKTNLLPTEVGEQDPLDRVIEETRPDLQASDHPLLKVFAGERKVFLDSVRITRRFKTKGALKNGAEIVARLRDDEPLIVAGRHGDGRTALILTTAGQAWHNWPRNPSYVVFLLELQAYLAGVPATKELRVGERWNVPIDLSTHRRTLNWTEPNRDGEPISRTIEAEIRGNSASASMPAAVLPGIYRLTKTTHDGRSDTMPIAVNVDPEEGMLDKANRSVFSAALEGSQFTMQSTEDAQSEFSSSGWEARDLLLALLVGLLLFEQAWAYKCSYHLHRS